MLRSLTSALTALVLASGLAAAVVSPADATTTGPAAVASFAPSADDAAADDWSLTTTTYSPSGEHGYVPTYLGNGYFSARIPAQGTGFSTAPVSTESQLAGFYGRGSDATVQRANLPAWSTLGFSDGTGTFGNVGTAGCGFGALCEAETGTLTSGAKIAKDHTGYTGSGFVGGFAASGNVPQRGSTDTLRITGARAGRVSLTVRYSAGANSTAQSLSAVVNGGTPTKITMPATSTWNTWATAKVAITVTDGDNTVALSCGATDTCVVNVDSIVVGQDQCSFGQYCEAESGTLAGSSKIASDHSGFGGTGFVAGFALNSVPQHTSTDTLHISSPDAGPALLTVRYAAATDSSAQTLSASVNGVASVVTMPATTNWDTWETATVPVTVVAGDNTVVVGCGAQDTCLANVDAVALSTGDLQTGDGSVSDYRQTLDLHDGLLTTSLTWTSPGGNQTALSFTVLVSEADLHVGAVRMTARPLNWQGSASFLDLLDGRANTLPASHRTPAPINLTNVSSQAFDPSTHLVSEKATTSGLAMTAGIASTLAIDGDASSTSAMSDVPAQSIGQEGSIDVVAGQTYTVTKYVGVASGTDTTDGSAPLVTASNDPVDAAVQASTAAAATGWDDLLAAHQAAWHQLWTADVTVPGDDAMTLKARSSMFYLLESVRDGVDWSVTPGGLSSAEYNGHVFWDAETWMYPALLAAHPDLAAGMNDYRSALLGAAQTTATTNGLQGAQFPWESAQTGADVGVHPREIHITGDVALAQWDYYQATGDVQWLRDKGWPIFQAVAQFYTSRSVPDGQGGYDLKGVEGPDENHNNVNNSAYTNVSAITSLQIADRAAALLGETPDPAWDEVASGLAASIPFDPATNTHLEYDNYSGQTINQADVVMMQYPWQYPMTKDVAQADLDYYTPRTSLTGPAMTDSINMINTASLSTPGCSAYTYFQRSIDPYDLGPFDQFAEHLNATGVIDFTTGIGGFLQELYYGFTGMRWNADSLVLDPMLPPQLPGLRLTGVQWQGRTFDVDVTPHTTTVTLRSGAAMPVTVAGEQRTASADSPVVVDTRRPDLSATHDLARCSPVTASSADPSYPPTAAVDGSDATSWKPTVSGASLTVDLGTPQPVRHVTVLSTTTTQAYTIAVSTDGHTWTPLGQVTASPDPQSSIDAATSALARYVRYTAATGVKPAIASLQVSNGLPGAPTAVTASVITDASTTVSWTPPTDNGDSPITGYLVTPYKDGQAQPGVRVASVTSVDISDRDAGVAYTFTVSATNDAGDGPASDASAPVSWSPPDLPPAVSATTDPVAPNGADGWFTSPVEVTAQGSDDRSLDSTEISVDDGAWSAGASPDKASVEIATDGVHSVRARATDSAGNVSAESDTTVKLDATPPVSTGTVHATTRNVTISATDNASGVGHIEYRVGDSASWHTYAAPIEVGAETTVVHYRAVDVAGNVEPENTVTVQASPTLRQSTTSAVASPAVHEVGRATTVKVKVAGAHGVPSGRVRLLEGSVTVGSADLSGGRATITLGAVLPVGRHTLTVSYSGDSRFAGSDTEVGITVTKARSEVTASITPRTPTHASAPTVHLDVKTSTKVAASGSATVRVVRKVGGHETTVISRTVSVGSSGKATLHLHPLAAGRYVVLITYSGNAEVRATHTRHRMSVLR